MEERIQSVEGWALKLGDDFLIFILTGLEAVLKIVETYAAAFIVIGISLTVVFYILRMMTGR